MGNKQKSLPLLFALVATPSAVLADFSLNQNSFENWEVFKATTILGTYHLERETPTGRKYNEFNPGGFLHVRSGKKAKCNGFGGSFINSLNEETVVVGLECQVAKTEALGGFSLDVAFGLALKGYNNYQKSFEEETGVPFPPVASIEVKSNLLKWGRTQAFLQIVPPSKHSAALAFAVEYKF